VYFIFDEDQEDQDEAAVLAGAKESGEQEPGGGRRIFGFFGRLALFLYVEEWSKRGPHILS
jgi:hypothetical protein